MGLVSLTGSEKEKWTSTFGVVLASVVKPLSFQLNAFAPVFTAQVSADIAGCQAAMAYR